MPAASVAEQVTAVSPSLKALPGTDVQLTVRLAVTVSLAVALKVATAPSALVASAVMPAGAVTTGLVVSRTVTVKLVDALFPLVSLAEQVTVVAPMAKVPPVAGAQVTVRLPSTRSFAVGMV